MPKKPSLPARLEGSERVIVQALMPISLIWEDFLQRHEYVDGKTQMTVNVTELMKLVTETNEYVSNVFRHIGVTQEQWDEIANEIVPQMYPTPPPKNDSPEPPHPDKNGDNPPDVAGTRA